MQKISRKTLAEVSLNSTVQVAAIDLPPEDEPRVKTMGLCIGRHAQLLQAGDPLIVAIAGAHVGMSRRLATGILKHARPSGRGHGPLGAGRRTSGGRTVQRGESGGVVDVELGGRRSTRRGIEERRRAS